MLIEATRALSMRTQGLKRPFIDAQPPVLAIASPNMSSPTLPMQLKVP